MIVYGTKGAHLKSEKVTAKQCDQCDEQTSHNVSIFGKYFYIYWIPVFPTGKKGVAECNTCKATIERGQMSERLRSKFDVIKKDTKTPITYWIGSLIIVGLISFAFFASSQHKKDVVDFISSPKPGDVVDYKPTDYYSTLKVIEVSNDSVYFVYNTMEISKQSKLYKIDKDENYSTEKYSLSKSEYQKMFDDKEFLDVER